MGTRYISRENKERKAENNFALLDKFRLEEERKKFELPDERKKKIEDIIYAQEVLRCPAKEFESLAEIGYAKIYTQYLRRINELVGSNLNLAHTLVSRYVEADPGNLDEYHHISEKALQETIERFNPKKHTGTISAYLRWWIKQGVLKYWKNRSVIRVPANSLSRTLMAKKELEIELEREPTEEEISEKTGLNLNIVKRVLGSKTTSLDETVGDGELNRYDTIKDDSAPAPCEGITKTEDYKIVTEFMSSLTEREQMILRYRFGFLEKPMTLEATAIKLGITRERVRQIQNDLLKKARCDSELMGKFGLSAEGNYLRRIKKGLTEVVEEKYRRKLSPILEIEHSEEELRQEIDGLKGKEKEVLLLRYGYQGKYYGAKEIGEMLGIRPSYVFAIQRKAIERVRRRIAYKRLLGN